MTVQTATLDLPFSFTKGGFFAAFQVVLASLAIGLLAQVSIPLYFSPVPLTGQTLGIMLVAALLGSRKGTLAVLCYLFEGAMGLPVFAGGAFGLAHLIGPTGGYFFGFIAQSFLIGQAFERRKKSNSPFTFAVSLLSASLVQLSAGTLWLSFYLGLKTALLVGLLPFIPVEALKTALLASSLKLRSFAKHSRLS